MMITGAYEDLIDELVSVKDRRYSQPSTTIVQRLESGKSLYDLSLPHFSQMQNVARLVSCRGTAEAKLGNPDAFLDMAQVLLKLGEGAANDGTLIGSLVQNAMLSVLLKDLEALIEERVFADEQLVRIAELIDRLDSLGCAERAFHYEMVYGAAVMDEFLESPKGSEKRAQAVNRHQNPSGEPSHFAWVVSYLVPDSLIRQNKATTIDWNYRLVFKPLKERDWEAIRKAASAVDAEVYSASWSPYAIFAKQAVPTVSGILEHVVSTEARRKMAVVAIDLERYRLANNSYPETIDLSDDDVLEGLPLRYERSVDGNDFLLYCDGWNNEDDHGDDGLDWVW